MIKETIKAKVLLDPRSQKRLVSGHPWIFRSDIAGIEGEYEPGDIVDVYGKNRFMGRGYINMRSQIAVRLLTDRDEEIDEDFFYNRILSAWKYRQKFFDSDCSFRVVFAESDFLPALIVDKMGTVLIIQTLSLGIDRYKHLICDILQQIIHPEAIYERNDAPVRTIEGLDQRKGFIAGKCDTNTIIIENGLKFKIDFENGQKTGYFLDQRENRAAIASYAKDAEVLDCFCYIGSFGVHAASYGAKKVYGIDISAKAVENAAQNAAANGYSDVCSFEESNVFDKLHELKDTGRQFDTIILDPPAFAKSRSTLENAVRGYKEINLRAIKLLKSGGFLVSCSCSHHLNEQLFLDLILQASVDAKRKLKLVELRPQPKDHPVLLALPESKYLKCAIFQVI